MLYCICILYNLMLAEVDLTNPHRATIYPMDVYNEIRGNTVPPKGVSTPRRREVGGCWHFDFGEIVFRLFNISYLTFANNCPKFRPGA